MTGDRMADIAVYALLVILPVAALVARRPPLARTLLSLAAWIGIFAVGLLIVGEGDGFRRMGALLAGRSIDGSETRIAMADDGHFWADATIDGVSRRMLIDSGATTTAISQATAQAAGLDVEASPFPVVLNTANGRVTARTATADRLVVGGVTARNVGVVVSPAFGGTDVIGMNILSRLASWRVEGRTLILTPEPPSANTN
ncbi:TIGR02281 family clan AA aspartic protease [Sphingomonas sp.]|uniref:retropepsin-like aspartic protease family protein n=1 Tax=Sphingomonas sp. TaxID=28214 RepID=UPI0035BC7C65